MQRRRLACMRSEQAGRLRYNSARATQVFGA